MTILDILNLWDPFSPGSGVVVSAISTYHIVVEVRPASPYPDPRATRVEVS